MVKYELDSLEQVKLRGVWPHEALDFTKWLSEEENLKLLSDAVGIELELILQMKNLRLIFSIESG